MVNVPPCGEQHRKMGGLLSRSGSTCSRVVAGKLEFDGQKTGAGERETNRETNRDERETTTSDASDLCRAEAQQRRAAKRLENALTSSDSRRRMGGGGEQEGSIAEERERMQSTHVFGFDNRARTQAGLVGGRQQPAFRQTTTKGG